MHNVRVIERPSFTILGKKTWIGGPDNEAFGRFWVECRAGGLLERFRQMQRKAGQPISPQTNSAVLGVSRVEQDPAKRDFYYMIAIEAGDMPSLDVPSPGAASPDLSVEEAGLERYQVPAGRWAVFECRGKVPESIVAAEMYAFMEWLPASGYQHALAPEMEVYPLCDDEEYCEFWLPIRKIP